MRADGCLEEEAWARAVEKLNRISNLPATTLTKFLHHFQWTTLM